jgi:hypothetical protein
MKKKILFVMLAVAVVIGAFFGLVNRVSSSEAAPPLAVTLVVDRIDDTAVAMACTAAPNDCSLRGAIRASNSNPSSTEAIIELQPATTYSLTLTNTTQENAAATGDLDVFATNHAVTIRGGGSSGANATTISAAGLNAATSRDRVFHIISGVFKVTFSDLIITGGQAVDDGTAGTSSVNGSQTTEGTGGGILNNGSTLSLMDVVVKNCRAIGRGDRLVNEHTTLDARGGGLASVAPAASVIITDSRFANDMATGGNGLVFNNAAGSGAQGGSIYFAGGTLNISESVVEASSASGGNGGNQDQNGQTNGGFGGTALGGGIWAGGGTVTITDTTFSNAVATGGNSGTGGNGSNPGGDAGGGALYSLANTTVTHSTFHLSKAIGGNAGHTFGTFCFGGHQSGDGGAARGGAVLSDAGTMIINTSTFANNSALGGNGGNGGQTNGGLNCGGHGAGGIAHGGAITNNNAGTLSIDHSTISGNHAKAGNTGVNQGGANKPPRPVGEGAGGGIRVGPGSVALARTIIAGNTATNGLGDVTGAPVPGPNVDGAVSSGGHNLLGVATEAMGFTGTGDKTGANPLLAALANNGGPTLTMALIAGSPAIDSAVAAGAPTDQRGQTRTVDDPAVINAPTSDGTDIGAVEFGRDCNLCCPNNIVVSAHPRERGAIVNFKQPTGRGCGRIRCDRLSGTLFRFGTTIVTCKSAAGPSCSFTVTVNRTPGRPTPQ